MVTGCDAQSRNKASLLMHQICLCALADADKGHIAGIIVRPVMPSHHEVIWGSDCVFIELLGALGGGGAAPHFPGTTEICKEPG